MNLDRREFLTGVAASGACAGAAAAPLHAFRQDTPFKLKYAPPLGMFREHCPDPVDQVKFIADHGFRAIEDNGMAGRPVEVQERIRAELDRHGMEMGVFVASADFAKVDFASDDPAVGDAIVARMQKAVEVGKRVGAKWCTIVPGCYDDRREWDYQTARVIDNLRRAAAVCEPAGLTMVLEPLNWWRDHPRVFLTKIPQAFLICRGVNSPACKILFDLYHQQITEGNLTGNLDAAWSELAYVQIGDHPGRCEPGTGEIHYQHLFRHLHGKGYQGILGMEHGKSKGGKEGELAVIAAYRRADAF